MMNQGTIMRRLLGQRANVDPNNDPSLGGAASPTAASYRPSGSQTVVYDAGVPISCLDASPDGRCAVLAGRHVLKVVSLEGLHLRELVDLRSLITAQPLPKPHSSLSVSDQLSIRDAKWSGGTQSRPSILTACASGRIYQYDYTRLGTLGPGAGLNSIQTREDSRQINTLDVSPHRDTYLLSGSQDGVVRFFDLRIPIQTSTGLTFKSTRAFKCHADPVRQVKWSIKDGFYFACATEQGLIFKWDSRKNNASVVRLTGHERPCSSISWHPDGDHLVSGGWDNKCYVWDLSRTDRRQKPKHTISTPAPVSVVAWRPGLWSATAQGKRAAQIAVSYDDSSQKRFGISSVHIWDLARPTIPFKEIDRFDSSPSGMLWHNHDLLWTAGQDGMFSQCDVAFAPRVIDRHSPSSVSFSPRGDAVMALDERTTPATPRPRHPLALAAEKRISSSYGSSPTAPMLSISRSDSEDDVVGSFLGSRRRGRHQHHESTHSSHHQLSTTPPSVPGAAKPVLSLDQGIKASGVYRNQQTLAAGHLPGANNSRVYQYLAATYMETLETDLPARPDGHNLMDRILNILEKYATTAENVSQFRLAQTWRILAYAITLLLNARAQYHLDMRQTRFYKKKKAMNQKYEESLALASSGLLQDPNPIEDKAHRREEDAGSSAIGGGDRQSHYSHRSLLSEEIDSTSNVTTPLARPVQDDVAPSPGPYQQPMFAKRLTPVLESEDFSLPPALGGDNPSHHASRLRLDSAPLSVTSHESEVSQVSSTDGYDFYDTEALRKAIDVPRSNAITTEHRRTPEAAAPDSPNLPRRPLLRNNSTDSYGHVFSMSDGSRRNTGLTASSSEGESPRPKRPAPSHTTSNETLSSESYDVSGYHNTTDSSPEIPRADIWAQERPSPSHSDSTNSRDFLAVSQTASDSFRSRTPDTAPFPQPPAPPRADGAADLPLLLVPGDDEATIATIREEDYLPWPGDPPYPFSSNPQNPEKAPSPPLNPYTLISRALAFETQFSSVNAAALVLLLKPLVPATVIDLTYATAILTQFHSTLMGMRHFVEAALLRNLCVQGWSGIDHWGDGYPSIFGLAQQGIKAAFMCSACKRPRDINHAPGSGDPGIWICDRCRAVNGPCAICGHREAAVSAPPAPPADTFPNEQVLSTWWYCPTCGHGGHSTCMQGWHGVSPEEYPREDAPEYEPGEAFSEGCCPLDGCGHACLPGKWRSESSVNRTEELGRKVSALERNRVLGIITGEIPSPGSVTPTGRGRSSLDGGSGLGGLDGLRVRGDWNEVPPSRAVESVRESFVRENRAQANGGRYGSGTRSSILGTSPGRSGSGSEATRERRKSVKFAKDGRK